MKKIVILALVICITFTSLITVNASEKYNNHENFVIDYFESNGFNISKISKPLELYDISGELTALCFTLNKTGYVIINVDSYVVEEFSFDTGHKYKAKELKSIYNGPLSYYQEDSNGKIYSAYTNEEIKKDEIKIRYGKSAKHDIDEPNASNSISTSGATYITPITKNISGSLVTYNTSYYCTLDATIIMLKYWDTYRSGQWLPSSSNTATSAHKYMVDNQYIPNAPWYLSDAEDGDTYNSTYYTGLDDYISDQGISSETAYNRSYSWSRVKTIIDNNNPLVISAEGGIPGSTWSSQHSIVMHGYYIDSTQNNFLRINDTFGSNNIQINASSSYYDDILYID